MTYIPQIKRDCHFLKCVEPHFTECYSMRKTFELRVNDRDYKVGDLVILTPYPDDDGRRFSFIISHILDAGQFHAVKEGYVILSMNERAAYVTEFRG